MKPLYLSPREIVSRILPWFTILACLCSTPSLAVFVPFENCLNKDVLNSNPLQLQWVPLFVDAVFNRSDSNYNLNVTLYGNVAGIATKQPYPLPNDTQWSNPNDTVGKITDQSPTNPKPTYSTLQASFDVLSYSPYAPGPSRFCTSVIQGECPIAPVFFKNLSDPANLPAFSVADNLNLSYRFTTITSNVVVITGDASNATIACISADITPDLGQQVRDMVKYLPLVVLIVVALATSMAAIFSPWGSVDVFRFTSNYGRDPDLLRLITPGFGDCLQYIQFIVLSGALSLNYPGYYQPVVSEASWSVLMFNQSFVTHGEGSPSVVDGVYAVNATYGLDRLSQYVGITSVKDIWAGMMIWLLVIMVALIALVQLGFILQRIARLITNTQQEDLRAKNIPFSIGNAIRIALNYLILPLVSLTMFQFVEATSAATVALVFAVLTMVVIVAFGIRFFWLFAYTRPRSYLFDDLPTVLLYGPLYNTYSDHAAAFALIPLLLNILRGIAIGAVQPSGIAQLVLLAICEVVLILTLNAFRPFHSPTSMNAIHTVFAVVRLVTLVLSVVFVPSLEVGGAARGWIGYVILVLHGTTLFIGFFLHSLQTLVEVFARLAGAGGDDGVTGGVTRGGLVKVFGMRQLSRRTPRRPRGPRNSIASDAAILHAEADHKSLRTNGGRSRSMSASSAILLNRQPTAEDRRSTGIDSAGGGAIHSHSSSAAGVPMTPTTPGGVSNFSFLPEGSQAASGAPVPAPVGGLVSLKTAGAGPYYRPPRVRRVTVELPSPGTRSRMSWTSNDWAKAQSPESIGQDDDQDVGLGPSVSGRGSPSAAHFHTPRERADSNADNPDQTKQDYATREVDFYYGVRGPALSQMPTRKLKTGPADPTGPVSSASGWFRGLFGGKTKEKNKGFEVVRSSRMPASMRSPQGEIALEDQKPYHDEPDPNSPQKTRAFELEDEGDAVGGGTRRLVEDQNSPITSEDESHHNSESSDESDDEGESYRTSQISQLPPSLPHIETGPSIELPSRIASKVSRTSTYRSSQRGKERAVQPTQYQFRPPLIPRKSSRRTSSASRTDHDLDARLSTITPSPPASPRSPQFLASHSRNLSSHSTAISALSELLAPPDEARPQSGSGTRDGVSSTGAIGSRPVSPLEPPQPGSVPSPNERPSSLGFVQQRRARDTIHLVDPSHSHLEASVAELVDDAERRSVSPVRPQVPLSS
ncbi:hypothetical protein MMC25_007392 [Agyrium rufum]|nr:hypothetical protein [Agyrium rufum]